MDISRLRKAHAASPLSPLTATSALVDIPEYIITSFFPSAAPLLTKYPRLFRVLGVFLALWYFGPITRLQSLWSRFSSLAIATITVTSEEDLFGYMITYLTERRTLRADQSLTALSNSPQEIGRRGPRYDGDEVRKTTNEPKIKYEQEQGWQLFVFKRRIFWAKRATGEGHVYVGNRYKRMEILSVTCLGRDTGPVKEMLEEVYMTKRAEERTLTTIRRPTSGGYSGKLSWSRLTSKPRRGLDTVILDGRKKEEVLADVEEYLDESTKTFYGNRGIPYRRGYLFHGPPGVGKTSFALALAANFNLDVYNLTLLDQDLADSDLMSLLNQLPGRSLLLLEDIDTAGLNRKPKPKTTPPRRVRGRGMPASIPPGLRQKSTAEKKEDGALDSDDEDDTGQTSNISLSGLLNAIDGVAAPEGHILIMTTNKPEQLDEALVRAGRISVRVGFTKATGSQAEEIFKRMYVEHSSDTFPTSPSEIGKSETDKKENPIVTQQRLDDLAKLFAKALPEGEHSPADLQDYLLVHKKDPERALGDVKGWMEQMATERRKKDDEKEIELEKRRKRREVVKESKEEIEEGDGEDSKEEIEAGNRLEKERKSEERKVGNDDGGKGEDAKTKTAGEEGAKVALKEGGAEGDAQEAETEQEADT